MLQLWYPAVQRHLSTFEPRTGWAAGARLLATLTEAEWSAPWTPQAGHFADRLAGSVINRHLPYVFSTSAIIRKYPLVRYSKDMRFSPGHHHLPVDARSLGRERTFLFHFKFLSGLQEYARESIDRECHWNASSEYRIYLDRIDRDSNLNLHDPRVSIRFRDTDTFLQQRMIHPRGRHRGVADLAAALLRRIVK